MRPKHSRKPQYDAAPPKVRRAPGTPTKNQLRTIALAEARAHVAKWKTLIPTANATWNKLHAADLGRTEGNVHMLAGLVQMHYQVSRQEADRQVKAFFDQYAPAAPVVVQPVAAAVAAAPVLLAAEADAAPVEAAL